MIDLVDQFPASPTGRQHNLPADRDDFGNAAFPGCDHGCDGAVLGTKPDTAVDINAYTKIQIAGSAEQSTGHLPGRIVTGQLSGTKHRFCLFDHLKIGKLPHAILLLCCFLPTAFYSLLSAY